MQLRLKCELLRRKHIPIALSVRQTGRLCNQTDHVHPEAVYAAVKPAIHHGIDRFPELWILPVQIRLLLAEQMQVPLAGFFIVTPRRRRKEGRPVVRLPSVLAVAPDIVIPVGIVPAFSRFHKPGVFIGGVIHDEIHHQLDVPLVQLPQKRIKILHCSKFGHDLFIVTDIISHVRIRRIIHRAQPDRADAQPFQMIQPGDDAGDISDPVAVGILKAARVDLVKYPFLPPCRTHCVFSFPFLHRISF